MKIIEQVILFVQHSRVFVSASSDCVTVVFLFNGERGLQIQEFCRSLNVLVVYHTSGQATNKNL